MNTLPLTVIAGLTRKSRFDDAKRVNLLNGRVSSSCSGDGGCFSAMTVKSVKEVVSW